MSEHAGWPDVWGATPAECDREYTCDAIGLGAGSDSPARRLVRAVDVKASEAVIFRWLCQLRVAPYSYDWIDNFGRRSTRSLSPGIENIAIGQRVMTIFTVVAVTPDNELTIRMHPGPGRRVFGDVAVSYAIQPGVSGSRLVAVVRLQTSHAPVRRLLTTLLAAGDAAMMRKQLKTLAELAEHTETTEQLAPTAKPTDNIDAESAGTE